jgi:CDP-diacylglycerol--glycerol-3-phosphate 3-phosphatidyltransferase
MIPLVMWLLSYGDPVSCMYAGLLFTAAAITDFLDGYIARRQGLVSLTGKFLDPLADKLIVMATLVMLVYLGRLETWIVVLVLARETSITGLRALAATEGIIIVARASGKFKTAFQLVGILGMIVHYQYPGDWLLFNDPIRYHYLGWWLFMISVGFSLYSGAQYFVGFLRGMDGSGETA